jgi:hypothetical protein
MAKPQEVIQSVQLPTSATKPFEGKVPSNIEGASSDPKYPGNQPAPDSNSGRWAKRSEKMFGRAPMQDASGKYKVGGSTITRPGKTGWDRSGKKDD